MTQAQFPDEQTAGGEYDRQDDAFREWVTDDGRSDFPAGSSDLSSDLLYYFL